MKFIKIDIALYYIKYTVKPAYIPNHCLFFIKISLYSIYSASLWAWIMLHCYLWSSSDAIATCEKKAVYDLIIYCQTSHYTRYFVRNEVYKNRYCIVLYKIYSKTCLYTKSLSIKVTFSGSLEWPLYTVFTVHR
jgi:hypothetical protein